MACPSIDHLDQLNRLITQYRESQNLKDYISVFLGECNAVESMLCQMHENRWVDTAEGVQLDIIGEIVGQKRTVPKLIASEFFGFDGAIGAAGFSTVAEPEAGGIFLTEDDIEYLPKVLSDTEMRTFIRAKIAKNHTSYGSIEEILTVLTTVIDTAAIEIIEGVATFDIDIDDLLTDEEKLILLSEDFILKPAGVGVGSLADNDGEFYY